ncbi:hypothetical protein HW555_004480 [Spodoptera exigua]|uniref:Uncharacterized protein n=1 Tax=Spodoptera exigua TaxID=7107 RepID=A0A835L5G4_SPOEX|nr:hypothetical protein HW555_004480 [Spodoptera exigua]
MGTSGVLKQMAEYDFSVPTDVTIIYEDNECSLQDNIEEQENLENEIDNKDIFIGETLVEERANLAKLSLDINDTQINAPILEEIRELNNTENVIINSNCKNAQLNNNHIGTNHFQNDNKTNGNSDLYTASKTIANKEASISKETEINNHELPVNMETESKLNQLSELLTYVIQTYYLHSLNKNTRSDRTSKRKFFAAKAHYFDLAFKTVESIIIPQEDNSYFIDKFLDKAVSIANAKPYPWKCQKYHIKSLLTHLIKWTKQKRVYLNNISTRKPDEYVTLKQQLARPLKPFNISQYETVLNSNVSGRTHNQNLENICIFTSGSPGSEISININAETLKTVTENRCLTEKTNGDYTNPLPNSETTNRLQVSRAPPSYEQYISQNKYPPAQHPPPQHHNPYNNSPTFTNGPQNYNQTNMQLHGTQNYLDGRQVHQKRHQHVGFQQLNHSTQMQHVNNSQMNNSNIYHHTYYDNMNTQMQKRPVHAQNLNSESVHLGPFNQPPFVRCHMCGKYIITRYSPYNTSPCTLPYCSHLCKAMNNQHYKPAWSGNA